MLDHLAALAGPLKTRGLFLPVCLVFFLLIFKQLEHLRITCDLMSFYFAFDEYTDVANKIEARKIVKDVMDAFRGRETNIQLPQGKITTMAQQWVVKPLEKCQGVFNHKSFRFIQRTLSVVGEDPAAVERFISDFDAYTNSIILEAEDRATGRLRTVNDYLTLRRDTCGAKPTFSFFSLGLNIPNTVFDNPLMMSLIVDATNLIIITNVSHIHIFGER